MECARPRPGVVPLSPVGTSVEGVSDASDSVAPSPKKLDREILALAVPALGALIAEPIFLLIDSAMVGHLGEVPLAGLGIAAAILQTIVGLMVFLAYSTTPAVARWFGAGDPSKAVQVGINGMWLALGVGAVLAAVGAWLSPWLIGLFNPAADVAKQAELYLTLSMMSLPAMLIVFATTGLLRGLQDTNTPLVIAVAGFALNAALNYLFMYVFHWGISGAALGTVIAQWLMVAAYVLVISRLARVHSVGRRMSREGIRANATQGGWLFLRTVSLRIALLATVAVATGLGTEELAGWHVVFTLFSAAAFALDALAIAAQALVGKYLGASSTTDARRVLARVLLWGAGFGVIVGLVIGALSPWLGLIFTGNPDLATLITPALIVLAVSQPLCAIVFVFDGVLMGAGDAKYLALAGALNLVPYLPAIILIAWLGLAGAAGLAWLAVAFFFVYMGARLVTLGHRIRTGRWAREGASL